MDGDRAAARQWVRVLHLPGVDLRVAVRLDDGEEIRRQLERREATHQLAGRHHLVAQRVQAAGREGPLHHRESRLRMAPTKVICLPMLLPSKPTPNTRSLKRS